MNTDTPAAAPRVLICDDAEDERAALTKFLRGRGYNVEEAANGATALDHLKNKNHDLILLDLYMPQPDGFEVLAYLQQHRRALPVILLSGLPLEQIQPHIHRLPDQQLPPLFIKPVDLNQLLQVIEFLLAGGLPAA